MHDSGVYPFRAIRYATRDALELARCIAPPYDVIAEAQAMRLQAKHPHNIVRIILGRKGEFERLPDEVYRKAGATFRAWLQQGVLQQDALPAIYLYRQTFQIRDQSFTRTGFFAQVRLEEPGRGRVKPHEVTFAGPKEDRYRLMKATGAQMSPVFGLFHDPEGRTSQVLEEALSMQAEYAFADEDGIRHCLWIVRDPPTHRSISELLQGRDIFIADGHHRYETAWRYCRESAAREEGEGRVLMMLCPMEDAGMAVLPTHRYISDVRCRQPLASVLKDDFSLYAFSGDTALETALERLRLERCGTLLFRDKTSWILAKYRGDMSCYRYLDVALLHQCVLEGLFGFSKDWEDHQVLAYERDEKRMMQRILDGPAGGLGVFLNATPIERLRDIVQMGERMPQKSTYFFPKIPTGLVIRRNADA